MFMFGRSVTLPGVTLPAGQYLLRLADLLVTGRTESSARC
jgi:hypothetical protein